MNTIHETNQTHSLAHAHNNHKSPLLLLLLPPLNNLD